MSFQSPEGDSSLFYEEEPPSQPDAFQGFSPPKGIRLFSTRGTLLRCRGPGVVWFQSPEGDSSLFYDLKDLADAAEAQVFQSPEGDSSLFYPTHLFQIGRSCHLDTTFLLIFSL